MAVGDDLLGNDLQEVKSSLEKGFRCSHVPVLAEKDIHEVAILIDATIEIAPPTTCSDIGLINEPGATDFVPSFLPQPVGEVSAKSL